MAWGDIRATGTGNLFIRTGLFGNEQKIYVTPNQGGTVEVSKEHWWGTTTKHIDKNIPQSVLNYLG